MGPFIKLLFIGVDVPEKIKNSRSGGGEDGGEEVQHLEVGNLGALELLANYPN